MALPDVRPIFTNFTAGEVSPDIEGRVDLAGYFNGCYSLKHFILMPQGGVMRRWGTKYVCEVKTSSAKTMLAPFKFSTTQAYILEFGNNYVRFYRNNARITSDATITNCADNGSGLIRVTATGHGFQTGNTVTIAGVGGTTEANATWVITVITVNTFDLVASTFSNAYVNGGTATAIVERSTTFTTAQLFQMKFAQSADVLYIAHTSHAPKKLMRYSHTDWVHQTIGFIPPPSVEYGEHPNATLTPSAVTGTGINLTASVACFREADVGRRVYSKESIALITAFTSTTVVVATVEQDFRSTAAIAAGSWRIGGSPGATVTPSAVGVPGSTITLTAGINAWKTSATDNTDHAGKWVYINSGIVKITGITTALACTATVYVPLANTNAATPGSWSLEDVSWGNNASFTAFGNPRAIGFHGGRLYYASSDQQPVTAWGSVTDDFENFGRGTNADDSLELPIASGSVNVARWIASSRKLLLGTVESEIAVSGPSEGPITPANAPDIKTQTVEGSADIQPVEAQNALIFVERSGTKLVEMVYDYASDIYEPDDLMRLATHLTGAIAATDVTITQVAYQKIPIPIIWCVLSDGKLLGLTYKRKEKVAGWHVHEFSGTSVAVESVAVIPSSDAVRDEVWLIVRRTINGSVKRYVEYMEQTWDVYSGVAKGYTLDSAVQATGAATNTISGLSHLEGESVRVQADGTDRGAYTVSSGAVTFTGAAATNILCGKAYTPTLTTVRPEFNLQGTIQGKLKSWGEVWARFKNTLDFNLNGVEVSVGSASSLLTGDRKVNNIGYDRDGRITVKQTKAQPITLLSIFGDLSIAD